MLFYAAAWNHSVKSSLGYKRQTNHWRFVFLQPMPNPTGESVATVDALALASQIVAEDDAAFDAAVSGTKAENGRDETPTSKSSDESDDKGQVDAEDEKPSDESTPPEETAPEPEKEPESEEDNATLKIGDREFATTADAIQEATRIMGRNAQLVGEIDGLTDQVQTLGTEVAEHKEHLQKAFEINQQWADWYQKTQKGENAAPPDTSKNIEEVVSKVLKTQKAKEQEEAQLEVMRTEFAKVESAPNYPGEVQRIVYRLSDQLNPITQRYFTPLEAYDFACKHLGVENALNPKPAAPAPKPPLKPATNPAVVRAAARNPAPPSGRGTSKTVPRYDEEDDFVDRSLRAGSLLPM